MKQVKWLFVMTIIIAALMACQIPGTAPATQKGPGQPDKEIPTRPVINKPAPPTVAQTTTDQPAKASATPNIIPTVAIEPTIAPSPTAQLKTLKVVVVDSNRNLWITQPGQAARQLTQTGDVLDARIDSSGDLIAFIRSTDYIYYGLWVIQANGAGEKSLVSAEDFKSFPNTVQGAITTRPGTFDWKPGSKILAFNTAPVIEGPGFMLNNDLWLVNPENNERRQLVDAGMGGMFFFSPDGNQIAISKADRICLVNADGSNPRPGVLQFTSVSTYSEWVYYPQPRWAADSTYLRVSIPPAQGLEKPQEPTTIWRIPTNGGPAQQMSSLKTSFGTWWIPFSPDLTHMAYSIFIGEANPDNAEQHIIQSDGSGDAMYYKGASAFMDWAPDSQHFLYITGTENKLYTGQIGSDSKELNGLAGVVSAAWTDKENLLALIRNNSGWELRFETPGKPGAVLATFPLGENAQPPTYHFSKY